MNTIKIYLTESGRVADLLKDFPLFQGQFNDKLLNVYVPTSILAPQFDIQHYIGQMRLESIPEDTAELNLMFANFIANNMPPLPDGTPRPPMEGDVIEVYDIGNDKYFLYVCSITGSVVTWTANEVNSFGTFDNIAGTSVKLGMIATKRNGMIYKSKTYFMRFLKTLVYEGKEYALYERKLPKEFTAFIGTSTIVANIVNIDVQTKEILSMITSQSCDLEVFQSTILDQDEELPTTTATEFDARISELENKVQTKQDRVDTNIAENAVVTTQNVVGAINQTSSQVVSNIAQINQNIEDIASNAQEIEDIKENYTTNENPVGNLVVSSLSGIEAQLNQLVLQVEGRDPEKGDVIMVTLQIAGQTDEIYKYFYTASGWRYLQMPALESASNTDKGLIQGTLYEPMNTQVDITGGKINAVYVKDNANSSRDVREYLNTTTTNIGKIISGDTKVGYSSKADKDANGNIINDTYLTQNAGVTKTQMRDYALPREFNDIYYLARGTETIAEFVDTKPSESITFTNTIATIGTYPLIVAPYISSAEFELSSKNSYQATFYISASMNTTKQFRLHIYSGLKDFCTEFSNEISMVANNVYKIQFNGNFTELDEVYKYNGSNSITVELSVVSTDTDNVTYTIYQNATYTSSFNLNTNKYTINLAQGELGEIPSIVVDGYEVESGTITFEMYDNTNFLKNNTLASFKLSYSGTSLDKYLKLAFEFGSQSEEYHLQTPYNGTTLTDRPKASDFTQTRVTISGGIVTIEFIGLIKVVENYGTVIYVDMDNLTAFGGTTVYVNNVSQAIVNFNSDPQTQISANAQNITGLGTRVGTAETDIDNIEAKIPTEATSSNKLADKDYVNNAINQFSAYYITKNAQGEPFSTKAELNSATVFYSGGVVRVPTTNDYCIVLADESKQSSTGVDPTTRYSYQGNQWEYQYNINDTPLTSAQLNALNSGITSSLVTQITTNQTNIANKMNRANPTGTGAVSINRKTGTTTGAKSVTVGDNCEANADACYAEGYNTKASGRYSHAEGQETTAGTGDACHAEGYDTLASGSWSHAEGNGSIASGNMAHAEGSHSTASGAYSHSEGIHTTASEGGSHTEGEYTTASETNAHAEGRYTTASGEQSHAEGEFTIAQRKNQKAFGRFNIADTTGVNGRAEGSFIEIVGNGTDDNARSNARTLDWDGNEVLAGTSQATGFKTATGTGNKLFADNGTAIEYQASQTDSANKIVQRDANRDVLVPSTPTSNNGATSKSYVDNINTNLQNQINALQSHNYINNLNFTPTADKVGVYAFAPNTSGRPSTSPNEIAPYGMCITISAIFAGQQWGRQIAIGNYHTGNGLIATRYYDWSTASWGSWEILF